MKKPAILLLTFLISATLFVGCAPSEEKTEITAKSPGVVPLGTEFSVDLNGDSKLERIFYSLEDFRINEASYKFQIQTSIYEDNPSIDHYYLLDVNRSDSQMELGITVEGPSGDPRIYLFTFDGQTLVELGSAPTLVDDLSAFDGKGHFRGHLRLALLQTWWAPVKWELTSENKIRLIEQDLYYPVKFEAPPVQLLVSLPIYETPSYSAKKTRMNPQEVQILATDNKSWCEVEGKDGTKGWFRVDNYVYITDLDLEANRVFQNLNMAD